MLGFFRKHQKVFFSVVTFFVVVSFVFFGTYNAFSREGSVEDHPIGHLIDGSVLKEQKLFGLIRLLEHGVEEGGQDVNFLNDSFVHKEIILSGLGQMLALHNFDTLQDELQMRWKRAKTFSFYAHPQSPQISAMAIWAQHYPKMLTLIEELRAAPEEFSREQLPLLFSFYAAQAEFPAPLLHQILYYAQMQQEQVVQDPGLPSANVALFGFQSVEDWFGPSFVKEIAYFVLNSACISREEGYVVKAEEAKAELASNFYRGLKSYAQNEKISSEEMGKYYQHSFMRVGLSEATAVNLWKEVTYFKRLFHEVGDGIFLDTLAFKQFQNFAKPSHVVKRYHLPKALHLRTFRDVLKFQRYIEIAGAETTNAAALPNSFHPAEAIMDAYPELVYKTFKVDMASISKHDAAARISLKETWKWEAEAENFARLQHQFPNLIKDEGNDLASRMHALDQLEEMQRFRVDQFARSCMVEQKPQLLDELLASAPRQEQELRVSLKAGKDSLFSGAHFLGLLEIEDQTLNRYSQDGETYYQINVLEKGKGWSVYSFDETLKLGVLDTMLDELLLAAYEHLDLEEPFEDCKDKVGAIVYKDLLSQLQKDAHKDTLDSYASHRFDGYLQAIRSLALNAPEAFARHQSSAWAFEEKLEEVAVEDESLKIGDFSPIIGHGFYRILEEKEQAPSASEMALAKEELRKDAEKVLMEKILHRLG